ncbi:MAG TPA: DUF2917 domain-containing protein [Albitalea sp.]|uniref:DUF2917 domain-containing protein n=1 Tax=Piscinibacter sp. TaxID=1903157 RepID=UPI002ED64627
METFRQSSLTELGRGEILRIEDGCGHDIAVFDGMLWVTQDGDERDLFVGNGDSLRLDRNGLTLVQAIARTRLVVSADRRRRPQRLQLPAECL